MISFRLDEGMQDLHYVIILNDMHSISLRHQRPRLFDKFNLLCPSDAISR